MINETKAIHEHHHDAPVLREHHHDACCGYHSHKRLSWTAVLVGALVGIGLSFLLNLLVIAIGLSTVTAAKPDAFSITLGGILGIVIGNIIAMIVAGYAAGYLGRKYCTRNLGMLYGFTTWTVALLLSSVVVGHISHYASSYSQSVVGTQLMSQSKDDKALLGMPQVAADKTVPNQTTQNTQAPSSQNASAEEINASPIDLAYAAFTIFGLFFVGALSTCIGASWAMSSRKRDVIVE